MKTTNKIKIILITIFIIIFSIIAARHFVGLHFKKKFSVRPAPGVIVNEVKKSTFYNSIETFGTAIAQNSKTYRIKKQEIKGTLDVEGRFVKVGDIIATLKNDEQVIAEIEGRLGKREIAQGVLGTDSLIITLDDLKKIIIDIKVPENFVSILKSGLKAEISSTAFDENFTGNIESVSSRVDPSTRSILARVIVDNSKFKIIPGQLLTVKIIYDEIEQIGVPESSVTIQGKTAFVYVVNGETVDKTNIQIGKRNFGKVSVLNGVYEGDQIVVEGVSKVRDKSKIKIIKQKNR
ncbi:efflux RND transporter periplasmic adaptor subunit [Pelagibacteraceae bacterium]|nr:efflux RND transporter periplasmic adaptor subunit [Pelagibacteraceae bacterium]